MYGWEVLTSDKSMVFHDFSNHGPGGSIPTSTLYVARFSKISMDQLEVNTSNRSIVSLKIEPWTGWKFILPTGPCKSK